MTLEATAAKLSGEALMLSMARQAGVAFPSLHILISDRCNHACEHCYQVHGEKGEITFDQLTRALRDFRQQGGVVVDISGGEATLRPDLLDLLRYAHGLGLATVLYTNGYTMTAELAAEIARANVWRVDISIYSHRASEHDQVTQVPGSWERSIRGIQNLRAVEVAVKIKVPLLSTSTATLSDLERLATHLDAQLHITNQLMGREGGDDAPLQLKPDPEVVAALSVGLATEDDTHHPPGSPCGAGQGGLTIRSDGVIQPCTGLFVELGRVDGSSPLTPSGTPNDAANFFQSLGWNDVHGCRDCDLIPYCSRCHASALAETGDMLGPYEGACGVAVARYRSIHPTASNESAPAAQAMATKGPFTITEDHSLAARPDVVTDADRSLASRFSWIRRPPPSGLVQLKTKKSDTLDRPVAPRYP